MMVDNNQSLPVVRVADIVTEENPQRWLIDQLWGASAVGVIGGAPKCSKTWLALDMSLSVATGTACLDRYEVPQPGPVLVYLAEDSLAIVRERVEGIARHRGLQLDSVPIHVITAPVLRLDRDPHRTQLLETARRLRPRLLLLDPLVRLHGIDENHAGEVAELLAYFRSLQRELDLSVVLVHHTRKNAAGGTAAGSGAAWFQRHPCLRRLEPLPQEEPAIAWCYRASTVRRPRLDPCTSIWSRPTPRRRILRWPERSVARSVTTCRNGYWISSPKRVC